jgi:peptide deformylase
MRHLDILPFGDPALRRKCEPVQEFDRSTCAFLDAMKKLLYARKGRAAIAAPQVGDRRRVIVMDYGFGYRELINPVIVEMVGEDVDWEGCLSFPNFTGRVPRAKKVVVRHLDRDGREQVVEASANPDFARCLQHEIDHLDGILYIDRLREGWLMSDLTGERVEVQAIRELAQAR